MTVHERFEVVVKEIHGSVISLLDAALQVPSKSEWNKTPASVGPMARAAL